MEAATSNRDTITAPIQEVVALFEGPLKGVVFPGVSLEAFEAMFRKVEERASDVDRAQAALDAAREALQVAHQEVLQQAQRTLAYAKVYADGNSALLAILDGIQLGKKPRAASKPTPGAEGEAPRRRGRKPKAQVEAEANAKLEESPVEGQA
jgi:multidrug efflux pump subunit AcrA (membrane-fusion protein)